MRTLFVYPEFPKTFWSYEKILELVNRKVLLPPLGMVTVATLLEQFLSVLAHNEHFLEYSSIVQQEIREQLESLPPEEPTVQKEFQPA